jgi:hypothetical protein
MRKALHAENRFCMRFLAQKKKHTYWLTATFCLITLQHFRILEQNRTLQSDTDTQELDRLVDRLNFIPKWSRSKPAKYVMICPFFLQQRLAIDVAPCNQPFSTSNRTASRSAGQKEGTLFRQAVSLRLAHSISPPLSWRACLYYSERLMKAEDFTKITISSGRIKKKHKRTLHHSSPQILQLTCLCCCPTLKPWTADVCWFMLLAACQPWVKLLGLNLASVNAGLLDIGRGIARPKR